MNPNADTYSLGQALPAEVLVGGDAPWNRYQRYPVFSRRWLLGRAGVFGLLFLAFALLSGVGVAALTGQWRQGALAGSLQVFAFFSMSMSGPALATLARHQRWPRRRERFAVVVAVLLGMGGSFAIDRWASAKIDALVRPALVEAGALPEREPAVAREVRPAAKAVNLVFLAAIYGLLGGGVALRAYFREHRRWQAVQRTRELSALRTQKQQADLRLGLLQAQVEPHFLFNTLASVRALVRQDPAQAEATLDALVAHLRATIPKLRDGEGLLHSTLGQQLDICASYLALMRLRMGGRLAYAIDADPALRQRPFPPLLLITLVENAIKHGIEPQPGPGRVDVRAGLRGDRLVVSVVDDGTGLQPGLGTGVGLSNVREQLAARYGGQASFSLRGLAGGRGAVAEISLPPEPEGSP